MLVPSVVRSYNEFRRVLQVNRVVFNLILDVFVARLYQKRRKLSLSRRLLYGIIRRILKREKEQESFPVKLRLTFERLGPTYVKMGQILSLRDDMLPEEVTRELRKLHADVPPISYLEVKKVIEEDFNLPIDKIFRNFDEEPFAAASLAQAHMATLRNRRKVVVKVQRPGIVKLIKAEINIMKRVAGVMERLPVLKEYRPVHFVEEFESYTMRELDFVQEGKHADRFTENFKDEPSIIFPKIYWDYTSKKVLTMQYIKGVRPDDTEKLQKMGFDGKKLAALGAKAILKMLYIDGFFHGDPHPGNMIIVGRSKIALIDLGMIGQFNKETIRNFFLYFYFMVIHEYDTATQYLVNLTEPGTNADIKGFKIELARAIKEWSGSKFKEYSMGKLIFETMQIGAKYQLYFHGDLVLSSKAIITIEAVGNILDPDLDLSTISRPMMTKLFNSQFSADKIKQSLLNSLPDYMKFIEKIPSKIIKDLSVISEGKIQLEVIEKRSDNNVKSKNSIFYPVMAASTLLAGTWMAISESTPGPVLDSFLGLAGFPIVSAVLFSISGIIFLKSIFSKKNI